MNFRKGTAYTALALLTAGLTGCNANDGAFETRYNNNMQPVGYYTNENAEIDNEGPLTEMMDGANNNNNTRGGNNRNNTNNQQTGMHNRNNNIGVNDRNNTGRNNNNNGYFRQVNNRNNDGNMGPQTAPLGNRDNGLIRDNRYSYGDANYHGHLNEVGYYNRGDGEISQKVRNSVEKLDNVEEARVLVTDNNILVAVDTNDRNDENIKDRVTNAVRKMADGRNVQVLTDEGTFTRLRNIDNDIQNGTDRKTIDADVNNLMEDIGDTMQRPFNQARD